MGYYVNPSSEPKETFLSRVGIVTPQPTELPSDGTTYVCLVDSGPFIAAAVVYDERELLEFTSPHDYRPRTWYLVETSDLYPVVDGLERVIPATTRR